MVSWATAAPATARCRWSSSGLSEVTAIAAGGDTCYALRRDGTVWVWGSGTSGELGTGSTADAPVPALIPGLTNVSAIAGGSETGYAAAR